MKKYQDCSWPIKLWRRRHYLTIPFETLYIYARNRPMLWWNDCYRIAKGLAQTRMRWTYSWDEVKKRLEIK